MINLKELKKRQATLLKEMGEDSIAILVAAKEKLRGPHNPYRFRQDSDFYYMTCFNETDAVAIFIPGRKEGEYILFSKAKDPVTAIWTGDLVGQDGAIKEYGADQGFPIEELSAMLPKLLTTKNRVYFGGEFDDKWMSRLMEMVGEAKQNRSQNLAELREFIDIGKIVHNMRLIKSEAEIKLLRKSAEISSDAHIRAMQKVKDAKSERDIDAEIMHEFIKQGGEDVAYGSIVACGNNACVLHYQKNEGELLDGELLLIDAGVEYKHYGTDITRTFPVNGKFSEEQKAIYQAVLDTQMSVIEMVRPGVLFNSLQERAIKIISEKLLALGILQGTLEEVLQKKSYRQFYMHGIGHFIGLDNKDAGRYKISDKTGWRRLEPGIVLTVEPGIYISEGSENVDPKWWGIGVRIEDNILVTKEGFEVLTERAPKEIDAIEKLMQKTN